MTPRGTFHGPAEAGELLGKESIGLAWRLMLRSGSARLAVLPITAAATFLSASMIIGYAGAIQYGAIALVGALFMLIPFSDLGLGAAVINAVAGMHSTRSARSHALSVVQKSFRILCLAALAVFAVALAFSLFDLWGILLGLESSEQLNRALCIAFALFAGSLPLGLGARILLGLSRNDAANWLGVIGPLVSLAVVATVIGLRLPPLLAAIGPSAGVFLTAAACFIVGLRAAGWRMRDILEGNAAPPVSVWSAAAPMLVISIALPLSMQSHRMFVSHLSPQAELAEYSLSAQFYFPLFSLISAASMTLWPSYKGAGDAIRRLWVRSLILLSGLGFAAAAGYILLVQWVGDIVSGGRIQIGIDVAVAFGALTLVMSAHQASAVLLTAPRQLMAQAVMTLAMLGSMLALSLLWTPTLGASGPVYATMTAVFLCQLLPSVGMAAQFVRRRPHQDA